MSLRARIDRAAARLDELHRPDEVTGRLVVPGYLAVPSGEAAPAAWAAYACRGPERMRVEFFEGEVTA